MGWNSPDRPIRKRIPAEGSLVHRSCETRADGRWQEESASIVSILYWCNAPRRSFPAASRIFAASLPQCGHLKTKCLSSLVIQKPLEPMSSIHLVQKRLRTMMIRYVKVLGMHQTIIVNTSDLRECKPIVTRRICRKKRAPKKRMKYQYSTGCSFILEFKSRNAYQARVRSLRMQRIA